MAAGKLMKAAARLLEILGQNSALAGGLAVNAHGYRRATRDVDVIAGLSLTEALRRLKEQGIEARLHKGDPLDGEFSCIKGVIAVGPRPVDIVPFDVLPPLVVPTPERTIELSLRDLKIRVLDPASLFDLKLQAGGPKDLYDVAVLCALHPDWEEEALRSAAARGKRLTARLISLMKTPQVAAQAREIQRQDAALRAFARKRARTK
jgi:nucleotidyltransferase AbiEii toxin of type IV toxin-antitoxin system